MTRADLVERIQANAGFSKNESVELLETLLSIIKESLEAGEDVKIPGFGSFEVKGKNDRNGRNPQTGEAMNIRARKIVTYRPSVKLKKEINGKQ